MIQNSFNDLDLTYLKDNYLKVKENINNAAYKSGRKPDDIRLMAVTKTVSPLMINYMLDLGVDLIGENKVQELMSKLDFINHNPEMHIIGHLQSNKVRKIINTVSMIQSVDSISLANEISRQAKNNNKEIQILLEVNIGQENSKSGFMIDQIKESALEISQLSGLIVKGIMCVPPICENETEGRKYFEKTRLLFEDIKTALVNKTEFSVLSMGMSSDYESAIYEGSTLVRIGSSLFGKRIY